MSGVAGRAAYRVPLVDPLAAALARFALGGCHLCGRPVTKQVPRKPLRCSEDGLTCEVLGPRLLARLKRR